MEIVTLINKIVTPAIEEASLVSVATLPSRVVMVIK